MTDLSEILSNWLISGEEELDITIDQFQCLLKKASLDVYCHLVLPINEAEFSPIQTLDIASVMFDEGFISPAMTPFGNYALTCAIELTSDIKVNTTQLHNAIEKITNFADAWVCLPRRKALLTSSDNKELAIRQALTTNFHYARPERHV
ncbi:hypothetical protein [Marinomonas mediterranea]|jgi:hypothetical protein|uniref:Uncharacterized protein n=1 Tax=Marinomonas mediterranea (strain ATCC 700492 / JCM 21426 / NBRC 103028 / MMB-1) TaxID=717774 RepID=F2JTC1_MARM1|nr:hypothetical protein [Marinomonas mediterranea]ADZ90339.1 hypothetical protein Marme_1064 [Marinomonas mediterranea MMB-1]WCN08395.1 hypothetical protein GV055_05410 [Marinomonas mediterranea]WCN12451.1 hypothetical protein GV054_05255 [Marinomonas mediterranea]WCN16523.1 hypothetical protein GV053_05385 [Marinomonas mediterranea MMB-1]